MALLLSCDSLTKSFGSRPLFTDISIGISDNERLGLIGPNGTGKSTLLKIFAGLETPDGGTLSLRRGTRLAYLAQEDVFDDGVTVAQVLEGALDKHLDAIEREVEINIILGQMNFSDPEQLVQTLSGGWRKRLALARELIRKPDLLLLDEPTNHLDMEGIFWLENLLKTADFSYVLISHDRYFLENVTRRVVELNRAYADGYISIDGKYSDFLVKKEDLLQAQANQEDVMAGKVKKEIEWLRRGPPARTTKAQARIDSAGQMMQDLAELKYRNSQGTTAKIDFGGTGRRTHQLIVAEDIGKSFGERELFSNLSFTLSPGTKLGLLGPNGGGKTSLLRLLTGELAPDTGTIRRADRLQTVFFDQDRGKLDLSLSLRKALGGDSDTVNFHGQPIHITSWAKRFLFKTDQLEVPINRLSGGEQARILIAQLMLQSADLLILDEPTNDLDIPSLEVLEESLSDFPGAMVLVTHDRYMLDRLSNELLALDGKGSANFFADFYQWERAQNTPQPKPQVKEADKPKKPIAVNSSQKLTRPEQRELDRMEEQIMTAETEVEKCHALLTDPSVISDYKRLEQVTAEIAVAEKSVAALYARWEELEVKKG